MYRFLHYMGQILDAMRKGKCCDLCGSYFIKNAKPFTHGFPATCLSCWQALPVDERSFHKKAEVPPSSTMAASILF